MTFQETLVRERKARGLSQEDLASQVQGSRQAVSKWETGDALPDLPRLLALADALGMSLDALCGREGPEETPGSQAQKPAPVSRRRRLALRLSCGALAACLLAGGLWLSARRGLVPAESAAVGALLDVPTVSGVRFSAAGGGRLDFRFVPGTVEEGCSYQLTFTDGDAQTVTADAVCQDGICTGSVFLPSVSRGNPCTAAVSVSNKESSRGIAVATELWFDDQSVSWFPAEE